MESYLEALRSAIASESADATLAQTLKILLRGSPKFAAELDEDNSKSTKIQPQSRSLRPGKSNKSVKATANTLQVAVLPDVVPAISPNAKYALATETINLSLKALTDLSKCVAYAQNEVSTQKSQHTSISQSRALQDRAGNIAHVPSRTAKGDVQRQDQSDNDEKRAPTNHVLFLAECTRLGFSYLRSNDEKSPRARESPKYQIEAGLLAFIARLIALGLDSFAIKELHVVKQRLWTSSKTSSTLQKEVRSCKATLASLLDIDAEVTESDDRIDHMITFHSLVLRVFTARRNCEVMADVLPYLQMAYENSPVSVALRFATRSEAKQKAVKHLEYISRILAGFGPLAAKTSNEENPCAASPYMDPSVVFELQCLSLHYQHVLFQLVGHQIDIAKDFAKPFSRCLATAVRDSPGHAASAALYKVCDRYHESLFIETLGKFDCDNLVFHDALYRTMYVLAEKLSWPDEEARWIQFAESRLASLDQTNARKAALSIRKLSNAVALSSLSEAAFQNDLNDLGHVLRTGITGTSHDYELTVSELSHLLGSLRSGSNTMYKELPQTQVVESIAAFVQRYSRTYPDKNAEGVIAIFCDLVNRSESSESLKSWITKDAVNAFLRSGTLRKIASEASTKPLVSAWSISRKSLTFGRIIKSLMARSLSAQIISNITCVIDDESLGADERGILLEYQLKCCSELAQKPRYRRILTESIHKLLQTLSEVYPEKQYPLRRARVGLMASQLSCTHPDLVSENALLLLMPGTTHHPEDLAKDQGLRACAIDTFTSLKIFETLAKSRPSPEELIDLLIGWRNDLDQRRAMCPSSRQVESTGTLGMLLKAMNGLCAALGDHDQRLAVAALNADLHRAGILTEDDKCLALIRHATAYQASNSPRMASKILDEVSGMMSGLSTTMPDHISLQYHLCRAECALSEADFEKCQKSMSDLSQGPLSSPRENSLSTAADHRLLLGQVWLLHSEAAFATGSQEDALRMAKHSVKIVNSIWAMLDHPGKYKTSDRDEPAIDSVAAKIKKLNLNGSSGADLERERAKRRNGVARWPVIPLLCRALLHLSDVYQHHGIFQEAKYYSEQALAVGNALGECRLLSTIRYHRVRLLVRAGCLDDAEICLEADQRVWPESSFIRLDQLRTQAILAAKGGTLDERRLILDEAQRTIDLLSCRERDEGGSALSDPQLLLSETQRQIVPTTTRVKKGGLKAPRDTAYKVPTSTLTTRSQNDEPPLRDESRVLRILRTEVALQRADLCLRSGKDAAQALTLLSGFRAHLPEMSARRLLELRISLLSAAAMVEADFSFAILPESTISVPAILPRDDAQPTELLKAVTVGKSKRATKKLPQKSSGRAEGQAQQDQSKALVDWKRFVDNKLCAFTNATSEAHLEFSILTKMFLLLATTNTLELGPGPSPADVAHAIEYSRMNASESYARVVSIDQEQSQQNPQAPSWPDYALMNPEPVSLASDFQRLYVDILPKAWTAVSLTLNDACDELCLTRYRHAQTPLILRLPFARHKPDGEDDEPFDFHMGKDELKEIIELSNYSCHNSDDRGGKGAKAKWWSEREALDRRLQELLINIENLWLGGFRGILSGQRYHAEGFSKFRKAFSTILDRHLPSRTVQKRIIANLQVDDQVIELFISLGPDDQADLDEPLSDLLYFVVDMLQFKGERNAYDEIDFDAMVVEIIDALRIYHDSACDFDNPGHLILVLDRRLHAFPWESIPCLDGVSVSRVDSLLTLRARIMEARSCLQNESDLSFDDLRHTITRRAGCYVLNPSGDLKSTEKALAPVLSASFSNHSTTCEPIIGRSPSEDELVSVLSDSSMLLYFGHGAGSQYIRPRAIRRLERCSEVVWLMGCSSGAVTEFDDFEPFMVPLAYLAAGKCGGSTSDESKVDTCRTPQYAQRRTCKAVVATLWDVTDKDIDRFSLAIGEEWGLWECKPGSITIPAKTPKRRPGAVAQLTPQRVSKTPRPPKVSAATAFPTTPIRNRSRTRTKSSMHQSIVEAVAKSRDACYLRYLNGAAPVVYGIPVYLGD